MIPLTVPSAMISLALVVWGTISEKTRHSRTRRAITWVYWEPKSRMTTLEDDFGALGALARTDFACAFRAGLEDFLRMGMGNDSAGEK